MDTQINSKVLIVIPAIPTDDRVWDVADLYESRSEFPCKVKVVFDTLKKDWVAIQNEEFRKSSDFSYYVYGCSDFYPGKGWLKKGFEYIEQGYKLVAFNDGRFFGEIATSGLVERKWAEQNYGGDLFHKGYKHHFADKELSVIAHKQNIMGYNPNAVLFEVDLEREKTGKKRLISEDFRKYKTRKRESLF